MGSSKLSDIQKVCLSVDGSNSRRVAWMAKSNHLPGDPHYFEIGCRFVRRLRVNECWRERPQRATAADH